LKATYYDEAGEKDIPVPARSKHPSTNALSITTDFGR
jgi:hypothetical protein